MRRVGFNKALDIVTKEHFLVEDSSNNEKEDTSDNWIRKKSVVLLGLLSNNPGMYQPRASN